MAGIQDVGKDAEARAQRMLIGAGLHPVARNYRCRGGEIDLVMRDGDQMVFIEVRYRSHSRYGGAASSVDPNKQKRLILAARHYLQTSRWSGPCRFDVVAYDKERGETWVRNAFDT
jgi:putative endonuclease